MLSSAVVMQSRTTSSCAKIARTVRTQIWEISNDTTLLPQLEGLYLSGGLCLTHHLLFFFFGSSYPWNQSGSVKFVRVQCVQCMWHCVVGWSLWPMWAFWKKHWAIHHPAGGHCAVRTNCADDQWGLKPSWISANYQARGQQKYKSIGQRRKK